jgi:hypothetical protein
VYFFHALLSFCFIFWQLHYFIFVSCAFFPLALSLNLLCFLQSVFFLMWLHFYFGTFLICALVWTSLLFPLYFFFNFFIHILF